mmetsp:Transcript_51605/g.135396  ORF Transcript_51605/g.135396 Transcript_51605/m.135396 type:complete len:414 (+) Transcript_51605:2-1243(+)
MLIPSEGVERRVLLLVGELQAAGRAPVHLVRAVGPTEAPRANKGHGQECVLRGTQAAVRLHGPVDDPLRHARHDGLDEAQQLPRVMVRVAEAVHAVCGLTDQQPRLVNLGPGLSHELDNAAHLCEFLPEGGARVGALTHEAQRTLCLTDHAHAVVDAAWPQPELSDLEAAALAPEDVGGWDAHVLEEDLHVAFWAVVVAEGLHRPDQSDAWRVHRNKDLGLLPVRLGLGARAAHQDHDLAIDAPGACDPMLPAIDDILLPIPLDACPDICRVAACHFRLRHGIAGSDLSLQKRFQPLLLLLLRAEARKDLHVPGVRARAVAGLSRELGVVRRAHDLAAICVLQVREAAALATGLGRGVHGQEEVEEAPGLGLLSQLEDNGWLAPVLWALVADLLDLLEEQQLIGVDVGFHEVP